MRRIYHHCETWECLAMYRADVTPIQDLDAMLRAYAAFLRDDRRFRRALQRVVTEWPISCEQFLLNESINRIAWLGQAAMCIETGVPRKYRAGFMQLSEAERTRANATAHETLNTWLRDHAHKDSTLPEDVGAPRLF